MDKLQNMRDVTAAVIAIQSGWVSLENVREANSWRSTCCPQIGKLALTRGMLTVKQVFQILGRQADFGGLFGQIAVQLGLLNQVEVYELLEIQNELTPSLATALAALGMITQEQANALEQRSQRDTDDRSESTLADASV